MWALYGFRKMKLNLIIAAIALLIPLVAELISPETGLGFDVLLYWPFDFAFIILVGAVFILANYFNQPFNLSVAGSVATSVAAWLGWAVITFLAVAQLHTSLGYKL